MSNGNALALQSFNFQAHAVRLVMIDEEPWFVAADVCRVLSIANPRDAVSRLDDDEYRQVNATVVSTDGSGRGPARTVVNEPGLYSLVLGSRKPEAKEFKRWITHEVLPQIRKTGAYVTPTASGRNADLAAIRTLVDAIEATRAEQERQAEALAEVTDRQEDLDARMGAIEGKHDWYSALGYARLHALNTSHTWLNLLGRTAASIGRRNGIHVQKTQHSLFGEVNMWPEWIWAAAVEARRTAGDARATEVEWS